MSGFDDVDPWPPYPAPSEESEATSDSGFRMLKLERQLEAQRRQMEVYQQQHTSILTVITELTSKMSVNVQQNANAVATPMYSYPPPPPPAPVRGLTRRTLCWTLRLRLPPYIFLYLIIILLSFHLLFFPLPSDPPSGPLCPFPWALRVLFVGPYHIHVFPLRFIFNYHTI